MDHSERKISDAIRGRTLSASGADKRRRHLVCCEVDSEARHFDSHQEDAEKSFVSKSILGSDWKLERGQKPRVENLKTRAIPEQSVKLSTRKLPESRTM